MTVQADRWRRWLPAGAILILLAVLVSCALRELLTASTDRLPGTDAGIHYTWEIYTRSILASGRLPHWNPYQYAGMPHLANVQMMVLYPPAMLLRWLPPATFLTYLAALHLVIGGAGALFLSRVLGLGWLASAIAAVAVALGGSVGPWLNLGHLLNVNSVAWLPWALGASILTVRRRWLLPHPALPAVLLMQLLAGYPQGTLYTTGAVALYFLYSAAWPEGGTETRSRWRPIAQLLVAGALTLGLSAFQLFPLARLAAEASRTAGLSFEDAVRGSWTLRDFTAFFLPDPRAPDTGAYVGWLLACVVPLAFFDRNRRRIVVFFTLLTIGAIALAFGDSLPFYRLHYALFPGFRIPGRVLFVATLSLAVLGAIGVAWLIAAATSRLSLGGRVGSSAACIIALAIVAADLTTFAHGAVRTTPADSIATIRRWLGPPDGGRVMTLCARQVERWTISLAQRPSIAGPPGMNLRDYVDWLNVVDSGDRPSDVLGRLPIRRDLLDVSNVSAVVACEPLDDPTLTLVSNLDSVRVYRNESAWPRAVWGCDGLRMSRTEAAASLRQGRYAASGRLVHEALVTVRWVPEVEDAARSRLEARYGLSEAVHREGSTWRYILSDVAAANVLALVRDPSVEDTHGVDRQTGAIAETVDAGDGPAGTSETVAGAAPCSDRGEVDVLLRDQPDGHVVAVVEAPVAGLVFFSEPHYPERVAFVDGRRVDAVKANLAFMAVPVPAGRHQVELRLIPSSFHAGLGVSALTLGVWVAAVVITRRRLGLSSR